MQCEHDARNALCGELRSSSPFFEKDEHTCAPLGLTSYLHLTSLTAREIACEHPRWRKVSGHLALQCVAVGVGPIRYGPVVCAPPHGPER